jgi:dihydroorotate dehydrogenase
MYKLIRPLLFKFDPEDTHNWMVKLCQTVNFLGITPVVKSIYSFEDPILESDIFGIHFKNPVGVAAGFDKFGHLANFLPALGFSHTQVGDTSVLPWKGNPRPRLFRLPLDNGLINRMGQNNPGVNYISNKFLNNKIPSLLFMSIVKTPNPEILGDVAVSDFVSCFKKLYPICDVAVINVSCPNTAEGKTFEEPAALNNLLGEIMKAKSALSISKPILVKFAPDLSFEELDKVLEISEQHKVDGYIITNTAKFRDGLKSAKNFLPWGGLSGQPLRQKATELVRHAYKNLKRPCLIGLGGINSTETAYERIKAGASLIQIYTGLIYEGPGLVKKINKGLAELLKKDGFKNISEAVGVEAK